MPLSFTVSSSSSHPFPSPTHHTDLDFDSFSTQWHRSRRNAENLEKFTKSTTINLINEPRQGKPLLVLDLDGHVRQHIWIAPPLRGARVRLCRDVWSEHHRLDYSTQLQEAVCVRVWDDAEHTPHAFAWHIV